MLRILSKMTEEMKSSVLPGILSSQKEDIISTL